MNQLSLVFRALAVIGGVAALVFFFMINGKVAEERAARENAEQARSSMSTELANSEERNEALEAERNTLRGNLATEQRNLESTRSELVAARTESRRNADRLREEQRERERVAQELTNTRNELTTALRRVESAVSEADFDRVQSERDRLRGQIAELEEQVNTLRMRTATAAPSAPATDGGAATVSRPQAGQPSALGTTASAAPRQPLVGLPAPSLRTGDSSFVATTTIASVAPRQGRLVLSGGSELNVSRGDTVALIADFQEVARVQISEVSGGQTTANILPGSSTRSLSSGLEVRLLR